MREDERPSDAPKTDPIDQNTRLPDDAACDQCGGTDGGLTRDPTGNFLCRICDDDLKRQQQFIDWGFGEAPDDLG